MAGSIVRSAPFYVNGLKVAEVSSSTEDRTVNTANQYGIEGVIAQSIGADEVKFSFDTVIPVQGMQLDLDELVGSPVSLGSIRNGKMVLIDGVLSESNYSSSSKEGTTTGKWSFIGGAPNFVG